MTQLVTEWLHVREIKSLQLAHPVHRRKGEGDGYDFIDGELEIAKALGMAQAYTAGKALHLFDQIVGFKEGPGLMTTSKTLEDGLANKLQSLDPILRETWTVGVDKQITGIIGRMVEKGARRAGAFRRLANLPTRALIEEGMVASTKYYSNTYFNRVVLPSMVGHINKQLEGQGSFDPTYLRTLREHMDTRLKSVPHWKLVGNQAASRAYHYGLSRAGMADGYTGYRLKAIIDDATTPVCLSLNGKAFWLADGVARAEKVARMLPSKMKQEAPWLVLSDVEGKDSSELAKAEVLIPPFHGNCRTTMTLER